MLKIEPDESGLKARSLTVPHITLEDTILADEVQNVRARFPKHARGRAERGQPTPFREGDQI
jgi:hypothetical protein